MIGGLIGCAVGLLFIAVVHQFTTGSASLFVNPGTTDELLDLRAPAGQSVAPQSCPTPTPEPERDDAIRRLRVLGVDPSEERLAEAAASGSASTVELLLKAGIQPDSTNLAGEPVLLVATEQGQMPVVSQLLSAGADSNATNRKTCDGRTPLMAAAGQGNIPLMECLLQHNAALDCRDSAGYTALHFALFARAASAVQWLVEHGAPLECDAGGKDTLLSSALDTWDPILIGLILQAKGKLHPLAWNSETTNALYGALRLQDKELTRVLLANHNEPPTPEGFHQPLLGYTIVWGDLATLRLMLECGADPNTPLGTPVERAFSLLVPSDEMRFYLQKERGMTPLMLAAGLGRLDCVQTLLEFGAKRGKLTQKYKMAALSFAARTKHPEIMQVLLGKSPLPEDQRTRVDISLSNQRAVLWKNDRIALAAPVSTGRAGYPTPYGRFVVTDKDPLRYSSIYKVTMPYFMRLSCSEFGMHAGDVPDYPASHGCIRLPRAAAIQFFKAVDVGTLVTIRP